MKKDGNFEINILPLLDILSVLICFLLLTAVWIQVNAISTQQAIGDNSTAGQENPPSLWITVEKNGNIRLSLRDVKAKAADDMISGTSQGVNWNTLNQKIIAIKTRFATLKTVIIRPEAQANYGVVIKIMDQLKQNQITDIGLSPLG